MRIQHNIAALNSYRQLGTNNNMVSKNLEKLSSGYKINRAGDDAAGLAISEKMRAQITGLETAQKNAQDGISLVQTAEGALTEVHSMLNRMTELATQSANGTYSSEVDRENLQKEVATLKDEIDRISKSTNFNGIKLLDGSLGDASGILDGTNSEFYSIAMESFGKNGSAIELNANDIKTGEFVKGASAQKSENNFYVSEKFTLKSTVTTGNAASTSGGGTVEFELTLGGAKVKVKLDSGVVTNAAAAKDFNFSMNDIIGKIQSGAGTGAIKGAITGGGSFEITLNTASSADIKNWGDINANFDFKFNKSGATGAASGILNITAKNAGADKKYEIGGMSKLSGTDTKAIEKALNDIKESAGAKYEFGSSTGKIVTGSDEIKASYKVSSTTFKINLNKLKELHGKSIVIDGKTYVFQDQQNTDPTKKLPNSITGDTTGKYEVITYDSAISNSSREDFVGNKLADAIRQNSTGTYLGSSGTFEKFEVSVGNDGTITISESKNWAEHMLNYGKNATVQDIKDKIHTITPTTNTDKIDSTNSPTININNDLKAGVWVTIDGKKYQFANKAEHVVDGGIFVQFKENDPKGNAEALLAEMKKQNPGKYDDAVVNLTDGVATIDFGNSTDVKIVDSGSKGLSLQVGDTSDAYQKVTVKVGRMDTQSLGIKDVDISEVEGAEAAIGKLRDAINKVSATRGDLGAVQNRLEHTINNLGVTTENITAAESRIRDTDMAEEMMAYTKNNILVQAAQAMLAQANTVPQGVLQLLG